MGRFLRMVEAVQAPTDTTGPAAQSAGESPAADVGSDVAIFLAARCCRAPRVWCELDRLHDAYRTRGGRRDRAAFAAEVVKCGGADAGAGVVAGIGLLEDWGPEDGGTRAPRGVRRHGR